MAGWVENPYWRVIATVPVGVATVYLCWFGLMVLYHHGIGMWVLAAATIVLLAQAASYIFTVVQGSRECLDRFKAWRAARRPVPDASAVCEERSTARGPRSAS